MRTRDSTVWHWNVSPRARVIFCLTRTFVKPMFTLWPTTERGIRQLERLDAMADKLPCHENGQLDLHPDLHHLERASVPILHEVPGQAEVVFYRSTVHSVKRHSGSVGGVNVAGIEFLIKTTGLRCHVSKDDETVVKHPDAIAVEIHSGAPGSSKRISRKRSRVAMAS